MIDFGRVTPLLPSHIPADPLSFNVFVAVTAAAFFLGLRRPVYGIALLILVEPFAFYRYIGETTLTLPKAALAGLAVATLLRPPPFALFRREWAVFGGLCALMVVALGTLAVAEYHSAVIRETLKWGQYVLTFVVVAAAVVRQPDRKVSGMAFSAITIVVCVIALLDWVFGAHSGLYVRGHVVARIAGPLEGPNQLAGWLGLMIPITLAATLTNMRARLEVAALVLASLALVLTVSRAGFVAGVIAAGIVMLRIRPSRMFVAAAVVALVAAVGAAIKIGALSHFFSVDESDTSTGLGTRAELWTAALQLWQAHPIFGVGAGNYELELSRVGLLDVKTHANNLYLQSLAEGGPLMVLVTIWAMAAPVVRLIRSTDPFVFATGAATVGFAIHQLLDDLLFYPKVSIMWVILIAMAVAYAFVERERPAVKGRDF